MRHITLSRNQCGRVPFPSVRILIFLRGAMSAISIMKLSSWPRSNLEGVKDRGAFMLPHYATVPCSRCSLHLASSLTLKVYECTLRDSSSSAPQSPATVFLARHLSPDLTGIPPPLENQAHTRYLEPFQAACNVPYRSDCNQSSRQGLTARFLHIAFLLASAHMPALSPSLQEGEAVVLNLLSLRYIT